MVLGSNFLRCFAKYIHEFNGINKTSRKACTVFRIYYLNAYIYMYK